MVRRQVDVKAHERTLKGGQSTQVRRHTRNIDGGSGDVRKPKSNSLSEDDKRQIRIDLHNTTELYIHNKAMLGEDVTKKEYDEIKGILMGTLAQIGHSPEGIKYAREFMDTKHFEDVYKADIFSLPRINYRDRYWPRKEGELDRPPWEVAPKGVFKKGDRWDKIDENYDVIETWEYDGEKWIRVR